MPKMFKQEGKVCLLKKSLYGLQQSPVNFFKRLTTALENRGLRPSDNDTCLYIGKDVICVSFVDDCLFFSRSEKAVDSLIERLENKKVPDQLALNNESDVAGFLGILLEKQANGLIEWK